MKAALSVLKEWVKLHGKPNKVMHDGGTEFTSTDFKNFLILNGIKDKVKCHSKCHFSTTFQIACQGTRIPGLLVLQCIDRTYLHIHLTLSAD